MRHKAKRFHESLDETNAENVRKQYNTIVLPLYQGFIERKPNYLLHGSPDFLNAIINSIKQLFEKQNIFKRIDNVVRGDYVHTSITE
jgi:transcription-repair coupling factor (superfamily II helicase)